jgi:Arc/MetJ-type ribon-helix-helix transcriptional regulator
MAPAERAGPEDEKITINLGPVDLGRIDLLVGEGVYSSRTDFIRDAIRDQLEDQKQLVDDVVIRKNYVVGYVWHRRKDLEAIRAKGERMSVHVIGMLRLADDVTVDLVAEVFEDVHVLGSIKGPKDVVAFLKSKRSEGGGT